MLRHYKRQNNTFVERKTQAIEGGSNFPHFLCTLTATHAKIKGTKSGGYLLDLVSAYREWSY